MFEFIGNAEKSERASYFEKKVNLCVGIKRAELKLTAIGVVKGYLNGEELAQDLLTPGWVNFNKRIPYYAFDVTKKLRQGENIFHFVVGNGWGVGKIAWFGKNHYADRPLLWCRLTLVYDDGTIEEIGTDESFSVGYGEVLENDIFDGENQDGNIKRTYHGRVRLFEGYAERLEEAIAPLTKEMQRFEGRFLHEVNGYRIYDFGQNHSGVPSLRILEAKCGTKLTVVYGEMLNADGSVYTDNLRTAKCTDTYVCREGNQTFAPLFTFHGYRYAGVKIEGGCILEEIVSRVLFSDMQEKGSFSCSDGNINKLFQNIVWGQKSNFINVPTDCPQRDERLGWSGDCQVFCGTAMYNMDCRAFFKKYLQDVRDAQLENGMIDCVAPTVASDFDHVKGAPAWGDVITVLPYQYYCMYKDISVIEENLHSAKRWVDYCVGTSENFIRPACGYGDWLSIGDTTDKSVLGTMYMAYSALLLSKMCRLVNDADEEKYRDVYERIKKAFKEKFVRPDGVIESDTQTVYLLAYSFGLLSAEAVHGHLLRTLKRKNNHLSTGFVGVKFLLPVLCDLREYDLAYELLTKTDYPSWCYSVVNGATTVWERWNSYTIEKGFADIKMNSFNHYSLGSVGEWIYAYLLGIRFTEEGCVLSPCVDTSGKITWAKGRYGDIFVEWKTAQDGKIECKIRAPKDCKIDLSGYKIIGEKEGVYTLARVPCLC